MRSGVGSFIQVGVEIEGEYLDSSMRNNSELWTEDSIAIESDVRDVWLGDNTLSVMYSSQECLAWERVERAAAG